MRRAALIAVITLSFFAAACGKKEPYLVNNDPNADGPPAGQDGSGCSSDARCDGGLCLMFGSGWRGGYCTTLDCKENGCHGDDAACIQFLDESSLCLDGCDSNADCRSGYRCRPLDATGRRVCYRDDGDGPPAGSIGAGCASNADCRDGMVCDTDVPGGYCTTDDCPDSCPEGSSCDDWNGVSRCVDECETTRDCRTGYVCDDACRPGEAVVPPFDFSVTEALLGMKCGGENLGEEGIGTRWRVTFDVPTGIAGYVVVPYVKTGGLRPLTLGLPSGNAVDLVSDYRHHNIRITDFQFFDQESEGIYGEVALDWPIVVPYTPDRAELLESGTHTMELVTTVSEPCLYVLPSQGSGTHVDINVVFMGLQGYAAATAPQDPDLVQVFARVNEILSPAGLGVGDVRYYDAPREIAERYAYVREASELNRATAFGVPRDQTLEGHLSVDMFLVQDLRASGSIVLGLSAGLPGPPGLHGNPANGLVFTGADLGEDNDFVAHIMAHELGHYLGLRHTTEVLHNHESGVELQAVLGTTDPIEDTPVCASVIFVGADCPDLQNLMFPQAPLQRFVPTLTEGQVTALRANPLVKSSE